MPHDAAERICPTTGQRIGADVPRSRMSEIPPPERRPEPLAFDARDRVAERAHGNSGDQASTLQPTRNLQRDLIGQTIGGRYRVLGVLGEGGMGTVYDAEHLGLGRHVAIKVLSPSQAKKRVAVKRFQQEARAAGAIGHPNICEVYDLGLLDDGSPYLVMEKLIGQTLADRIGKEGGLPFDELVDVMIQVLSGLIAAHDKGIVHRDIKPENIFLARRIGCPPIIKILDFGVSKMISQFQGGEEQLDLTRTGMVMGTPYYMSPEQARGERSLDGRVDVYACGVMMYEAIAGKRPFLAPNYNALLLAIINTNAKPLREIRPATPRELEAVVAHAMEKNRDERYPSAMHLLRDLQKLASNMGGVAARVPPPPTAEERKRAPVLGGRRPDDTRPDGRQRRSEDAARPSREHLDRPDGPGATLRSRMNERAREATDPSTRLDIRLKVPAPMSTESDSIDIPIHITGSETPALPERAVEYVDEMPTEVFRPGHHPAPRPLEGRTPLRPAPPSEDWDGETIVKRPGHLPSPSRRRDVRAINPDETVKLDGNDIDFSDETRVAPPRRPR
jgi:eukaryotic-like serine/threonine-protein kinase